MLAQSLFMAGVTVLKMATVAPDGTTWAHEMKAMAREVESATHGEVLIKWYWGGIAGDELQVAQRIERGQLDGSASGGMLCARLAPTMRALRVPGVIQSRKEATYLMNRLAGDIDKEFRAAGYTNLVAPNLGPDIIFLRRPVTTFTELQKLRLWRWDLDEVPLFTGRHMGMAVHTLPLDEVAKGLEDGRLEGLIAIPAAALSFRWYSRGVRHFIDLSQGFLAGCIVVANRSFDRLTVEQQKALRAAGAKLLQRADIVGSEQDRMLLGGLFEKQGVTPLPVPSGLRDAFFAAAKEARAKIPESLVPRELLSRVLSILADYRAQHAGQ